MAIYTAEKYQNFFKGIIIENTFTSIPAMVDVIFPFLSWFKWIILRIHWENHELVKNIQPPMLFVTGNKDEIVPHEMTVSLYHNAAKALFKRIYIVEGGTHNDTWIRRRKEYME